MEHFFRIIGAIIGLLRAEKRQLVNRYFGEVERFEGNARSICRQIVEKLWEGDFYRTSLGHYDFFWMRDFGTVAEALMKIGNEKEVRHTLKWAMHHYRKAGVAKLCIDKSGNVFNAPAQSIDALPWLLHSLVVSDYELIKVERVFLKKQLTMYCKTFLDQNGQMKKMHVGEMRDAVIYDRSAYAVTLIARMARCVEKLHLEGFPYPSEIYKEKLLAHYWNGTYFKADYASAAFSAECALMPFWLKVITDDQKAAKTFDYIEQHKLNYPYPLKYTDTPEVFKFRFGMGTILMPDYAGTTIWSWHAAFYIKLLKKYNRPEYTEMHQRFSHMIEQHGTFPEMLNPDGSWYYAPIYKSDPGMVWAALYIDL